MSFKEEILRDQKNLNEIYAREIQKGTFEDWLKRRQTDGGGRT